MKPEMKKRLLELAKIDDENRKDLRFLTTMGFFVAKGLLGYNRPLTQKPNIRLAVQDAIWAGKNVEPRILEVLPAAFLRLEKHFLIGARPNADERALLEVRNEFRKGNLELPDFLGIPREKYVQWFDTPLRDRRTRTLSERKRMKAFRLRPTAIERLADLAARKQMSESDFLEELIEKSS